MPISTRSLKHYVIINDSRNENWEIALFLLKLGEIWFQCFVSNGMHFIR